MDWKISLDRYLSSGPPDNGYDDFFEAMVESSTDSFFDKNENWLLDSEEANKWASSLFDKGKSPQQAMKIIERLFTIKNK